MVSILDFIQENTHYIEIFLLMLSAFIIGYTGAWYFTKNSSRKLIKRLKKEVNSLRMQQQANNIDTIFTEIKPKIAEMVKQSQQEIIKKPANKIPEENKTTFINYSSATEKPELDFDTIGYADRSDKDDLTQISGIGPYIENKLNEIGIYNFDQISRLKREDILIVTELIDFFPGRIERDDWVGQAENLKVF